MGVTAYYGSRISDSISRTPEGFLVCRDVPIARIGMQEYLGSEVGQDERPNDIFQVTRAAEEVFSRPAIASFEGKPVCDNHPDTDVTSRNYSQYMRGVVRDVRKGTGQYEGFLLADLLIHDEGLAQSIQEGKREISCGYNCLWVPTGDHKLEQKEIRGNHVAIVDKGRAGRGVAIHDSAMERSKKMNNKNQSVLQRMFAAFVKDANPEEALEAAKLVNEGGNDAAPQAAPSAPVEKQVDPGEERFKRIEDALDSLTAQLAEMKKTSAAPQPQEEGDALDALESELQGKTHADEEKDVTADPEAINAAQSKVADDGLINSDEEENPNAVRDAALETIGALRPVVAAIGDKVARRNAADALAGLIRRQVNDSGYLAIQRASQSVGTKDHNMDDIALGRDIAKRFNPHYQK
ncbi:MAG: DUF2213 domain-containing protein [Porphyromonas sp.]|nr:DUF2213 domain-containing protein [Porphyromonas sp.]